MGVLFSTTAKERGNHRRGEVVEISVRVFYVDWCLRGGIFCWDGSWSRLLSCFLVVSSRPPSTTNPQVEHLGALGFPSSFKGTNKMRNNEVAYTEYTADSPGRER